MEFHKHTIKSIDIIEIDSDQVVIETIDAGIDLVGTLYFEGVDAVILRDYQLNQEFFDLKTGMAGEILQKFSTYRIRIAIVGDFSAFESKSLQDFIKESNQGKLVNFCSSKEEAIQRLSN